jgi:hypothetical protein
MSSLTTWIIAASVMVALSLAWRIGGVGAVTPATGELGLLRGASALRPLSYDYQGWRFGSAPDTLSGLKVTTDRQRRPVPQSALFFATRVPAGEYRVGVGEGEQSSRDVVLRVGTTPIPMWRMSAKDVAADSPGFPVRFATNAQSVVVESSDPAQRAAAEIELTPLGADRPPARTGMRLRTVAHRAVPYGPLQAFFIDDHAYPEPGGFWVAGGHTAEVVIAGTGTERELFLRNTPLDNIVVIDLDGERHEVALRAREETTIRFRRRTVDTDAVLRIRPRQGVRPSQLDPGNADKRYLGCWVEIR